jgi:hypothetical protein
MKCTGRRTETDRIRKKAGANFWVFNILSSDKEPPKHAYLRMALPLAGLGNRYAVRGK